MATTTTRTRKVKEESNTGVVLKVKRLREDAVLPERKTDGAACFDLWTPEDIYVRTLNAEDKAVCVPTGLAFEIPEGYHMKIFLRSSIGLNTKLRLANQIGIIDSDYRGEVQLLVENPSRQPVRIPKGTRVAQCLIEKNIPVVFEEVKELRETKRGKGGLGSTGKE